MLFGKIALAYGSQIVILCHPAFGKFTQLSTRCTPIGMVKFVDDIKNGYLSIVLLVTVSVGLINVVCLCTVEFKTLFSQTDFNRCDYFCR